jgi:predicted transcriptional regulator
MANKVALMSIMTKHSNKIFEGNKLWEFRKMPPRINADDDLEIIVYSSKVEKSIVGKFKAGRILYCQLDELMRITGYENDKEAVEWFKAYYKNKEFCSAIEVLNPIKYKKPISLSMIQQKIPSFRPPQNFIYVVGDSVLAEIISQQELGG